MVWISLLGGAASKSNFRDIDHFIVTAQELYKQRLESRSKTLTYQKQIQVKITYRRSYNVDRKGQMICINILVAATMTLKI